MLKKMLATLDHIASLLWRLLEVEKASATTLHEILGHLERMDRPPEQAEVEPFDPDAWMQNGITNILGYQPGGKKGEK